MSIINLTKPEDVWTQGSWSRDWQIVDYSRSGLEFWLGHLGGARYAPKSAAWTPVDGVEGMLPPDLAQVLARLGLNTAQPVLVYDNGNALYAARFALALAVAGYPDIHVLEGGLDVWKNRRFPTSRGPSIVKKISTPSNLGPRPELVATLSDVQAIATAPSGGDTILLDTRTTKEFTGAEKRAAEAGRIPRAIHWEWKRALDTDGLTFKSPDALRAEFSALGLTDKSKVITYCQSGVRASHTLIALHLAGIKSVQVYDGSWTEWGNRSDTPKVLGVPA